MSYLTLFWLKNQEPFFQDIILLLLWVSVLCVDAQNVCVRERKWREEKAENERLFSDIFSACLLTQVNMSAIHHLVKVRRLCCLYHSKYLHPSDRCGRSGAWKMSLHLNLTCTEICPMPSRCAWKSSQRYEIKQYDHFVLWKKGNMVLWRVASFVALSKQDNTTTLCTA